MWSLWGLDAEDFAAVLEDDTNGVDECYTCAIEPRSLGVEDSELWEESG